MEKEYTQKYLQINRGRNIIFDGNDMPFFSVSPELSDLGESLSVAKDLRTNFPALRFGQACVADGAIIIQDIAQKENNREFLNKVKELNRAMNNTLQVVNTVELTQSMLQQLEEQQIFASDPVIILPGNGAKSVAEQMRILSSSLSNNVYELPTERTMVKPGQFKLSIDYTSLPDTLPSQRILILDDVVASGQTARALGYALTSFYPNVSVDIATWLFLRPTGNDNEQSDSGIGYVNTTTASIALKGNYVGRPPINSLSCFLMDDSFSQQKVDTFARKYARDPKLFRELLEEVKKSL